MGGSGGTGIPGGISPGRLAQWMIEASEEASEAEHNNRVNEALDQLLVQYNRRDVDLMRERLDEIEKALEDGLEEAVDLRFGGSIAKHTFIDGLSDVDALVVLRREDSVADNVGETLDKFAETLDRELSYTVAVHEGRLAVTVSYDDGMEIQLLPSVRTDSGLKISAGDGRNWSNVIRPAAFANKLTERNQECSNRLVPVIKLAKAALAGLDETIKPTGYHVESVAVEAFKGYTGQRNYKSMLQHFFERGSSLVLSPIRDSTRQSIHVDDNLGSRDSRQRRLLSGAMNRIARRMANADMHGSRIAWMRAIGEEA